MNDKVLIGVRQAANFHARVLQSLPELNGEEMEHLSNRQLSTRLQVVKTGLPKKGISAKTSPFYMDDDEQKEWWQKLGDKIGDVKFDLSGTMPKALTDFGWIQPPLPDIGVQDTFEACGELMPVDKWTNEILDSVVSPNSTSVTPPRDKIIRLRATVNSDEVWKSHSANVLWNKYCEKGFLCLSRRLLLEAWYTFVTRNHLDVKTWNICASSHYVDGDVPNVYCTVDHLWVDSSHPGRANDARRAREVFSQ